MRPCVRPCVCASERECVRIMCVRIFTFSQQTSTSTPGDLFSFIVLILLATSGGYMRLSQHFVC